MSSEGHVARKQTNKRKTDDRGGALGDFAEQVGTLLGQAEARWRSWQGPETRDAIVDTVKDVRDRASRLLEDMGVRGKAAKPARSPRKTAPRSAAAPKRAGRKAAPTAKAPKRGAKRAGR
jgi:hypothetical protein